MTTLSTFPEPAIALHAVPPPGGAWRRYIAPAIAVALLGAALLQLGTIDLRRTIGLMPAAPGFWALFALCYLVGPTADWLIFRRLWRLPVAGFAALLRKAISNEVLLGYSGEAYFYGWAKRHGGVAGAPFGAIKDVAILSAAAGGAATLLLLGLCWPELAHLRRGLGTELLAASIALVAAGPLVSLACGRRLFGLTPRERGEVALIHAGRILAGTVLTAALWQQLMPGAPLRLWVTLAALRLVVTRLPLVPNKDVIFAGVAVAMLGRQALATDVVTLVAGLMLATHLLLGASLALAELAGLHLPRGHGEARR